MILITHPRCGSHWLAYGVKGHYYSGHELFSEVQGWGVNRPEWPAGPYDGLSIAEKLGVLKAMRPTEIHKIHVSDLSQKRFGSAFGPDLPKLIDHLKQRDDVYLLQRRNIRAAIVSMLLAIGNGYTFHNTYGKLTARVTVRFETFFHWYRMCTTEFAWIEQCLTFREKFFYEDLVSGITEPQTFAFDSRHNTITKNDSFERMYYIENLAELRGWMDTLKVPGSLDKEYPLEFSF